MSLSCTIAAEFVKNNPKCATNIRVYLVLSDEAVDLQRFSPAQTDLLLVAAAEDGIYRNRSGNWNTFHVSFRNTLLCLLNYRTNRVSWRIISLVPSSSVSTSSFSLSLRPSGLLRTSLRLTLVNGGRLRTVCCGTALSVSYTSSSRTSSFSCSLQEEAGYLPVSPSPRCVYLLPSLCLPVSPAPLCLPVSPSPP